MRTLARNARKRAVACIVLAAALALAGALAGCGALPVTRTSVTPVTSYDRVEVREYEGKKLSLIGEQPENSIKGPQAVDIDSFRLTVDGLVVTPLTLTYSEVTSMPSAEKVVELHCIEGWTMTYLWEGVLLGDLLAKAGGTDPSAKVVIFHCVDGYTSSLPLEYVLDRKILLGYRMNGVTMPPERGYPFQVIAEDRYGYKWAKWVKRIEVSSDARYLGYWEKRGYDNGAELLGVE